MTTLKKDGTVKKDRYRVKRFTELKKDDDFEKRWHSEKRSLQSKRIH